MGYKFETEHLTLPKNLDRRRKLSDEDKDIIKQLYMVGTSIRQISRNFEHKCTRRNIQFILFPERLTGYSGKWKLYKPSKEKRAEILREHRQYKYNLYNKTN